MQSHKYCVCLNENIFAYFATAKDAINLFDTLEDGKIVSIKDLDNAYVQDGEESEKINGFITTVKSVNLYGINEGRNIILTTK